MAISDRGWCTEGNGTLDELAVSVWDQHWNGLGCRKLQNKKSVVIDNMNPHECLMYTNSCVHGRLLGSTPCHWKYMGVQGDEKLIKLYEFYVAFCK
jgi:hypothetical protein